MAKTEADFNAAFARWQIAQQNMYNATNGKTELMRTEKAAIDQSNTNLLGVVQRAENLLNGTTTPVTPPPTSGNASLALMKSAILAAPTTYAAVPSSNVIQVIQGAPNRLPVYPDGSQPVLHYFAFPANNADFRGPGGSPDILTVGKFSAPDTYSFAYNGDSRFTQEGGANVLPRMWCQEIGAHVGGITHTGRYFSFMTRFAGKDSTIKVNGDLQPTIVINEADTWTTIDLGSRATRNLVYNSGGNEFGGFAVPVGDTIIPYDHTAGKPRINMVGDSWMQRRDYENRNMRFPDLLAMLLGAHSVGGSVRGGTGYAIGDIPATDAQRRIDINAGAPHAVFDFLQVNDGDPANTPGLQSAVRTVMERIRADNPNAVYNKVCWTSKGSTATVTGGETRKRDLFYTEWLRIPGPKIFTDCMVGKWYADKGDGVILQRATALGPMIDGEGSVAAPTGSGRADTWIDEPGGRHETHTGVVGTINQVRAFSAEALAVM